MKLLSSLTIFVGRMYKYLIPSSSTQAIQRNDAAGVAAYVTAYPIQAANAPLQEKIDLLKILRSGCGEDGGGGGGGGGCVAYQRAAATLLSTERNTRQLALVVQALGGQELLKQNFHRIEDLKLRTIANLALG